MGLSQNLDPATRRNIDFEDWITFRTVLRIRIQLNPDPDPAKSLNPDPVSEDP